MKKMMQQGMKHYREEKELFIQNKTQIEAVNAQVLKGLLFGSILMCAATILLVVLNESDANVITTYGVATFAFGIIFIVNGFVPKRWSLLCFYLFFAALLCFSAYSAAVVYPDYTGVISLGVFVLMPILILDKSARNIIIEVGSLVAYLAFVIPHKVWLIHQDEMIYNISFAILGLVLGLYLRRVRLENLEMVRQGKIRETTDALTGLFNRRKLFGYFGQCEAGKAEKPLSGISILDIDYFKDYNDTYGHLAGDDCLRKVGECLRAYGQQHDMEFYRYGGEEFVAVAHEEDSERLLQNFMGIRDAVEGLQILRNNGVVTVSQGVRLLTKDDKEHAPCPVADKGREGNHLNGLRFQQYLSEADKALYQAKEEGRNRTVLCQ